MRFLFRLAILVVVAAAVAYVVSTEPSLRHRLPWQTEGASHLSSLPEPAREVLAGDAGPAAPQPLPDGFTTYPTNRGGSSDWDLVAMRSARHESFDRVVLDVEADTPYWDATLDAAGDGATLTLTVPAPVTAIQPDADLGIYAVGDEDQYSCTGDPDARLEVVDRCGWSTSGQWSTLTIELDRSAPYRVQAIDGRLVIDVLGSGEVSGAGTPQDAVAGFVFAWDEGNRTAMASYATGDLMDDFDYPPLVGNTAMDAPSCTGAKPTARCEDVWVYEDMEDHTATHGFYTFDLRYEDDAWWITDISCDPIYDC